MLAALCIPTWLVHSEAPSVAFRPPPWLGSFTLSAALCIPTRFVLPRAPSAVLHLLTQPAPCVLSLAGPAHTDSTSPSRRSSLSSPFPTAFAQSIGSTSSPVPTASTPLPRALDWFLSLVGSPVHTISTRPSGSSVGTPLPTALPPCLCSIGGPVPPTRLILPAATPVVLCSPTRLDSIVLLSAIMSTGCIPVGRLFHWPRPDSTF